MERSSLQYTDLRLPTLFAHPILEKRECGSPSGKAGTALVDPELKPMMVRFLRKKRSFTGERP
jgi:hypothetical protein